MLAEVKLDEFILFSIYLYRLVPDAAAVSYWPNTNKAGPFHRCAKNPPLCHAEHFFVSGIVCYFAILIDDAALMKGCERVSGIGYKMFFVA